MLHIKRRNKLGACGRFWDGSKRSWVGGFAICGCEIGCCVLCLIPDKLITKIQNEFLEFKFFQLLNKTTQPLGGHEGLLILKQHSSTGKPLGGTEQEKRRGIAWKCCYVFPVCNVFWSLQGLAEAIKRAAFMWEISLKNQYTKNKVLWVFRVFLQFNFLTTKNMLENQFNSECRHLKNWAFSCVNALVEKKNTWGYQ